VSQAVTFHQGNLVSGQFPFAVAPYDVIYCRNLLIYFDRSTQERVMQTLGSLLAPEGILFVGPAEACLASSSGFTAVSGAASFAFRKTTAKRPESTGLPLPGVRNAIRKESILAAPSQVKPPPQPAAESVELPPADLVTAQRFADQGHLREAIGCCERNLSRYGPSAEAYYLLGVVRDAAGERDRAAECYRRAVYLEPNHAEALTHLALFSQTQGDGVTVRRLRGRALRASAYLSDRKVVTP
jgi:chemotaxis protein methyltransferase WspC